MGRSTTRWKDRAWSRRLVTVPTAFLAFTVLWAGAPLWLFLTVVVDILRPSRGSVTRMLLFGMSYATCVVLGLLCAGALWVLGAVIPRATWVRWHYELQRLWTLFLSWSLEVLFQLRYEVEGDAVVTPGPVLVLIRHSSLADALLPSRFVHVRHRILLRFVTKAESLLEPCLDIVGNRLPNAFVRRGVGGEQELALVRRLGVDLPPDGGILIYPEGTRFTVAKRQRRLAKMAERSSPWLRHAEALEHVLPLRPGGTLAVMNACPDLDVVIFEHHGIEQVMSLSQILAGGLVGAVIHIRFRRYDAEAIPEGDEAKIAWLYERWAEVNAWVEVMKRKTEARTDP